MKAEAEVRTKLKLGLNRSSLQRTARRLDLKRLHGQAPRPRAKGEQPGAGGPVRSDGALGRWTQMGAQILSHVKQALRQSIRASKTKNKRQFGWHITRAEAHILFGVFVQGMVSAINSRMRGFCYLVAAIER